MLTYKNETDKDVKATIRPADPKALPTEIIIKAGETYDVPAEMEAEFLRWMMEAKTQDNSTPDNENEDNTQDKDTNGDEVNEESEADKAEGSDISSETEIVKNDRDFDIEVTYKNGEEDKKVTIKAGEEISVPKEQVENVKTQIAEAKNPDEDDSEKKSEETDKFAEERKALAEERMQIARERAEMQFDKLCESGKVVPAQKKSFMALATAQSEVALAEGDGKTVSELLEDFIKSAPQHSLMDEEGKGGEGEKDVELTDEDKQVAETFGNSEEDIKKTRKDG